MPTRIDHHETQRLIEEEHAFLVEVLPESAYEVIHLPGAVSIPLQDFETARFEDVDRARPVIVYCYDYQ